MSVEKVNKYKESKATRKADLEAARKRKTRNKIIGRIVSCVVILGLAFALVLTAVNMIKARVAAKPDYDAESIVIDQYVHDHESDITDLIGTDDDSEVVVNDDGSITVTGKTEAADDETASDEATEPASEEPTETTEPASDEAAGN